MDTESNLSTEKFDIEFSHDPLFRKATAKFDERGAKGLTQNVSKLSNKGLEILFYTGNSDTNKKNEETKEESKTAPLSQIGSCILSAANEFLKNVSFEELAAKKINEGMIDYKHTKLKIAYPSLDLTLFSAVNTCFTQSSIREEIEPMAIEPIAAEDDQWLSKLNNEKEDEEFSLLGALGTQDSIQAYDVTSNNDLDYIDYRRL